MNSQHAKMSRSQRAKQFAPFSPLTGLTKALEERERRRTEAGNGEIIRTGDRIGDFEFYDISIEDAEFADGFSYDTEDI